MDFLTFDEYKNNKFKKVKLLIELESLEKYNDGMVEVKIDEKETIKIPITSIISKEYI